MELQLNLFLNDNFTNFVVREIFKVSFLYNRSFYRLAQKTHDELHSSCYLKRLR